ncbi:MULTISPECIES: RdgB/HAM1 family non-canonical purine NTP pyrophosphatase [Rhodomicrobium]|uniref:RdgB/HAM1 family non-canonical purine NTP pyrophosphatase n=1 Tax=Rhodomicrobium TaxID=1068 RepID=UPI000B4AA63E|nr:MULTISPECIES: RdgB/HAM1 family non-canonical purine NTP pyrophosphatase [Rhodomicrobium]
MVRPLTQGDKLVIASHNKGKVVEFRDLLAPMRIALVSSGELGLPEPEETGDSFAANALLKAEATATASGLPSLADDSGIEIEALDGAPGIYSARWAGESRDFGAAMRRVEEQLRNIGALTPAPRANFACVLCFATPDGESQYFEGKVFGHLTFPPRGENGFGYDPIFVPDGHLLTFGQMAAEDKHRISHRAIAFEAFAKGLLPRI